MTDPIPSTQPATVKETIKPAPDMSSLLRRAAGLPEPTSPAVPQPAVTPTPTPTPVTQQAVTPTPVQTTPASVQESDIPSFLKKSTQATTPQVPPPPDVENDKDKNFANLRKKAESLESRLAEVFDPDGKVKMDFVKKLNIQSPDMEKIQQERDAALDRLSQYDLQADPRWRAKYASAENAAKTSILRLAKDYGVEQADMEKAMSSSIKERQRFLQEQMPDAVPLLAAHLARLDEIQAQKEMDIQNAKETRKSIELQHTQQREQAIAKTKDALFSEVTRELEDGGLWLFKQIPGNEEFNKITNGVRETFKTYLGSNDAKTQAAAMAMGAATPALLQMVKDLDAQLHQAKTELALRSGASPSITPASTPSQSQPKPVNNMSHLDFAKQIVASVRKST